MIKKNPTFPPSKIKKIIQQNQQVGKLSNVVPYLVERSLQLFLSDVLQKVNQIADANDVSKACPSILKKAIEEMPKYEFMKFAVDDLEEFQGMKKKKSEIKSEKVQRKKSSKGIQQEPSAENTPAITTTTKRGRKKASLKEQKQERVEQQVDEQI